MAVHNLYTHSGVMHADDVLSAVFLRKYFDIIDPGSLVEVKRIDNQTAAKLRRKYDLDDLRSSNSIMFDIGLGKFDHHEEIANKVRRGNGVPYAAAGKIWKEIGSVITKDEYTAVKIDECFLQIVDARDNGVFNSEAIKTPFGHSIRQFINRIRTLNNLYRDSYSGENKKFTAAMEYAEKVFDKLSENIKDKTIDFEKDNFDLFDDYWNKVFKPELEKGIETLGRNTETFLNYFLNETEDISPDTRFVFYRKKDILDFDEISRRIPQLECIIQPFEDSYNKTKFAVYPLIYKGVSRGSMIKNPFLLKQDNIDRNSDGVAFFDDAKEAIRFCENACELFELDKKEKADRLYMNEKSDGAWQAVIRFDVVIDKNSDPNLCEFDMLDGKDIEDKKLAKYDKLNDKYIYNNIELSMFVSNNRQECLNWIEDNKEYITKFLENYKPMFKANLQLANSMKNVEYTFINDPILSVNYSYTKKLFKDQVFEEQKFLEERKDILKYAEKRIESVYDR